MAPAPRPIVETCPQKANLFRDLGSAMAAILALNNHEIEAVIAGEFNKLELIQAELHQARERKSSVLTAYRDHVETHGC